MACLNKKDKEMKSMLGAFCAANKMAKSPMTKETWSSPKTSTTRLDKINNK